MIVSRARLLAYAAGDFAFNLYWQSVMLYLLFFYSEGLHLGVAQAAACYALAMAWDGGIGLVIGLRLDRTLPARGYRRMIAWGALPLGLSFALAYAPWPLGGDALLVVVLAFHLLFRTAYALVNIPYLALSARLATGDAGRAWLAGARMLAGTLAAVVVAVGTLPIGNALGATTQPHAFALAALVFAVAGSAVLVLSVLAVPDPADEAAPPPSSLRAVARAVIESRLFVHLGIAILALVIAATMIEKAVLYYFKYALGDQQAGELALGWMMATGALAVPAWMAVARQVGTVRAWLGAVVLAIVALALFVAGAIGGERGLQVFLVTVQVTMTGVNFALWALLPRVIEAGEAASGLRMGAAVYGLFALVQRVGIGLGTLLLGLVLGQAGLGQGEPLRLTLAALPLGFLALSAVAMLTGPLMRERS